ncbi:hypothetical protein CPU12_08320 [Malaciobacter molluscorum LMG 25693]|uniref:RDD family membrane protein n=1 Tax=Malaciobacter molluscorum LMG 25693 TaxID=870501 RepID=A0A2G1DHG8_9BACT|nr:RDD family protein [Malaciobacter molluscorum]AXX93658.1 RDD family membrane protein [Malaciobacter molluscorum LMG 25693]PHO17931.1 hypothetical protein CPU12_08320 [Malaciobacter molluscorum LMG 25693]
MAKWRDVKQNRIKNSSNKIQEEYKSSCASLFSRFKAFITDSFLITTPIVYIVIYLVFGSGDAFSQNRLLGWSYILSTVFLIICFFWYVKTQTPGMKAYSLKIVSSKKQRINIFQAMIRYIATLISIVTLFLLLLPFFNKDKKTFQDYISKTIIIDE